MSAALASLMPDVPETSKPSESLVSFLLIGGFGSVLFVLLSSVAVVLLPFAKWQVNACCYATTILPIYLLHRRFSFRSEAAHRRALPRYVCVQLMALVLAALFSFVI